MIREMRNKVKLEQYYQKFMDEGAIDPNVHPWVSESWRRSQELAVPSKVMPKLEKLDGADYARRLDLHRAAVDYVGHLYDDLREFFHSHNLSLLLMDAECYVLKSYAMPFFQKTPGELAGARVAEADVGTSSISLAVRHKMPFLLFGPEMWIEECHQSDACSAPILVGGELQYVLTLVSVDQAALPYGAVVSLLLTMRSALETYLTMNQRLRTYDTLLDAAPFAAYHVLPDGTAPYANRLGRGRFTPAHLRADGGVNLREVFVNYDHTPVTKGLRGLPSYYKEVSWLTDERTYEDIVTVVPLQGQAGAAVVSLPIDDLRTLIAHAVSYPARYSFNGLVGKAAVFTAMRDKALRVAKGQQHVLLQGEPGTGKERLAHAIHQASPRVAGPFIVFKCGRVEAGRMEEEMFGIEDAAGEAGPGKFHLARGGTLFLDEVEKLSRGAADRLAAEIQQLEGQQVRLIAACDSDLKRLQERGLFSAALFGALGKTIIRVPSLRSRREDIPILARHILEELAAQNHMPVKTLSPLAEQMLAAQDWAGNIKQLQVVLEHAFFHAAGLEVRPEDIVTQGESLPGNDWKDSREVFLKAWQSAGGNVSRLSQQLRVSRVTLYRYLKKFGLSEH